MRRYSVEVDGREFDITIEYTAQKYIVTCNGKTIGAEAHFQRESRGLMLIDNESHEVDVRSDGYSPAKTVYMKGQEIPVLIEDYNLAQLRKTAGMTSGVKMERQVNAAMPGLVLDVKIAPGDEVKKGQPLLVLEAMKMENIIKSQGEATVKAVKVNKGQSVEKGDVLLEFE